MSILIAFFIIYVFVELVNYTTKKYGLRNLSYSRSVDKKSCSVNDKLILSVQLTNNKLLPVPFVETMEKLPAEFQYEIMDDVYSSMEYNYHHSVMSLMPYQRITRKYIMHCKKRGRYYFQDVNITIGDLFGFNTFSTDTISEVEVLVYPEIKPLSTLIVDYRNPQGDVSVKRWIIDDPNIVSCIREYTSNDPFNRIHWASTARRGELTVKNYDFTSNQKVFILLNIETAKPFWVRIDEKMIERAVDIAAAVSDQLLKSGMGVGITTNASLAGLKYNEGNHINPSWGSGHMPAMLELLARVTTSIHQGFEELLAGHLQHILGDCHYIIITPIVTGDMVEIVNTMARRCRITLISIDPENMDRISDSVKIFSAVGGDIIEAV